MFIDKKDILFTDMGDGITRRALSHGDKLMACIMTFPEGSFNEPHSHEEHEQFIMVLSGKLELTCNDEKRIMYPGDAYYARPGEIHCTRSLEDGSSILDIHAPLRWDILNDPNSVPESELE